MGILGVIITIALAVLVKRQWPGIAWLALNVVLDVGFRIYFTRADPRSADLIGHAVITIIIYGIARSLRRWKADDGDGKAWALATWQFGSIATFINLTFFDGYVYTWWNWIFALAFNAFLGEIWPIYWIILRPLMGH